MPYGVGGFARSSPLRRGGGEAAARSRNTGRPGVEGPARLARRIALAALAGLALAPAGARACVDEGRPCCDYCRMIITEKSFGAEIRTAGWQLLSFDSHECMAAYWLAQRADTTQLLTLRAIDYSRPGTRVDARTAWFLRSASRPSPMGLELSAYGSADSARSARRKHPGEILRWNQVVDLVLREWFRGKRP